MWELNGYKNTRTYAEGVEKSQTIQRFSAGGLLCRITTWDICARTKLSQRRASSQASVQTSSPAQRGGSAALRKRPPTDAVPWLSSPGLPTSAQALPAPNESHLCGPSRAGAPSTWLCRHEEYAFSSSLQIKLSYQVARGRCQLNHIDDRSR